MATEYKIHPAIGIARVGNSPDEWFIGPERIGEFPDPPGGFKDAQCRVKRQAVRFRIYAHHDDGTVEEITEAEAEIMWTVHLVNKKAANPGHSNSENPADLTIDPGPRSLNGPNQSAAMDTGQISFSDAATVTVPLGEIRTDDANHLLVLGGSGTSASPPGASIGHFWANADWYDDVGDGPVSAQIRIRASGDEPAVAGAWVIVAPPKFAPQMDSVVTLYDRIQQAMVDAGLATAPSTTSYTEDIYPILQRAIDTDFVELTYSPHAWTHPVTNAALVFGRLSQPPGPGSDMPDLNEDTGDNTLTPIQYAHMERWNDGNFTADWTGVPDPADLTPEGIDRAALQACVGAAFFPGIEAGGRTNAERPIIDPANYGEAFRLDHVVVNPGDMSYTMALPWQADFSACADNWWPVPRPNDVTPSGQSTALRWERGVANWNLMVQHWHTLGFVVRQGSGHVEVERCDTPTITLMTPHLNFVDVPQGPMGMVREHALAISFEVVSPSAAVTLEYAPGGALNHPQLVAFNSSDQVGPTGGNSVATARLWVIFRTASLGAIPTQTVSVREVGGSQEWTVTIDGNTVPRQAAAVSLVLDRSGSMDDDRGDGVTKHVSLQQAAGIFVDLMVEGDEVSLVRYNQDAQELQGLETLGAGGLSDVARSATNDLIHGSDLDPTGATSIGDGIFVGRGTLSGSTADVNALVVLTDGVENRSLYISDVAPEIDEFTYAIGLGTPQNTSAPALQTISGNTGGFLLITGAIDQDNRFLLQKYFLQVLAGVSNAEVVLDPNGELTSGTVRRIPFQLTEADAGADVIVLTPRPDVVDFRVQTPTGLIIEPWRAAVEPDMRFDLGRDVAFYRFVLPTELEPGRTNQGGTWHALLRIGRPRLKPTEDSPDGVDRSILRGAASTDRQSRRRRLAAAAEAAHVPEAALEGVSFVRDVTSRRGTLPYSLAVHAYSSVSLRASVEQPGFAPGAVASLSATVTESGIPIERASVWAEVSAPDGTQPHVDLKPQGDGSYRATLPLLTAGVYRLRIRGRGTTRRGRSFARERLLTAAVWRGGDRDPRPSPGDLLADRDERLCELLSCLLSSDGTQERLRELGIDPDHARKCLSILCRDRSHRRDSDR